MREKLIELLREVQYQGNAVHGYHDKYIQNGELADHLIANGVVVSKMETTTKWIPVTERLPGQGAAVLVFTQWGGIGIACQWKGAFVWIHTGNDTDEIADHVTHWMPLPEPPKGE